MNWKFVFVFSLIFTTGIFAQPKTALDSCEENFNIAWEKLHASRDTNKILNKALAVSDSIEKKQKEMIVKSDTSIVYLQGQLKLYQDAEKKNQEISFISWDGFYINGMTYYVFDPATISNQIVKTLRYAISGEFTFKVMGLLKFSLESVLPIGDKFRVNAKVGYKLF